MIGAIVSLACLTTATGLVVAVSEYFHEIFPKISYKMYAVVFTLFSLVLANQGLSSVIAMSVPVLLVLYPIAMTLLLTMLLAKFIPTPQLATQIPIFIVTIIAILSVLQSQFQIAPFMDHLPLKGESMEWLLFAIVGYVIGLLIGKDKEKIVYS